MSGRNVTSASLWRLCCKPLKRKCTLPVKNGCHQKHFNKTENNNSEKIFWLKKTYFVFERISFYCATFDNNRHSLFFFWSVLLRYIFNPQIKNSIKVKKVSYFEIVSICLNTFKASHNPFEKEKRTCFFITVLKTWSKEIESF